MIKSGFAVGRSIVLALLVAAASTSSFARDHHDKNLGKKCHDTTLKVNIYNGQIIRTDDGYVFQIDKFSQFETEFWLAGDDMTVCVTKKRVDGRVVTHYTIKDTFFPEGSPDGERAKLYSGPNSK